MFDRYPGFLMKTLIATIAGWLVFSGIAIWDVQTRPSSDIAMALLPAMIAVAAVFSLLIIYPVVMAMSYWALGRRDAYRPWVWIIAGVAGGAVVTGLFGLSLSTGDPDVPSRFAVFGAVCGTVTAAVAYALFLRSKR